MIVHTMASRLREEERREETKSLREEIDVISACVDDERVDEWEARKVIREHSDQKLSGFL